MPEPRPPLALREAAALLQRAGSLDALAPLAAAVGIAGPARPLDAGARHALGLDAVVAAARVAAGEGALRALLVELAPGTDASPGLAMRDALLRIATRLTTRAPHPLWLVLARRDADVAIAAWSPDRRPPRVAALIADRRAIVDSDAETVRALAAAADGSPDLAVHARWLELLGRDALSRRFYRTLEGVVDRLAARAETAVALPPDERRTLALLVISRLLFLAFLEAKGWLDGDRAFLRGRFEACMRAGGGFHRRVLTPLFFGTLNTVPARRAAAARAFGRVPFLNGGLFARAPVERRAGDFRFDDATLGEAIGDLLGRYRFTAREDRATWSEAAIDPEMLGRAFESLMASRDRRAGGAFYTPQPLVERVSGAALAAAFSRAGVPPSVVAAALSERVIPAGGRARLRGVVDDLRLLDPACGSGAFLVHVLERLAGIAARCGDARPTHAVRRDVLERSIFGVDRDPTAVWLCELRLWLAMVIDDPETDPLRVPPLPNLDHHVRVGDALSGGAFDDAAAAPADAARLARLRAAYARASGSGKRAALRRLDREERARNLAAHDAALARLTRERREWLSLARARDLFGRRPAPAGRPAERRRELREQLRALRAGRTRLLRGGALPFSFPAQFADVAAAPRGGFDIVLGNPPWVRLHRIPAPARDALRRAYRVFRHAAWTPGALRARAGAGFAGQVDAAALFAERAVALLRPGGTVALLLPAKLWSALAGGGVRRLFTREAEPLAVEDWSDAPTGFDAVVYPSMVLARKRVREPAAGHAPVQVIVHRARRTIAWEVPPAGLGYDESPGAPWLLLPPEVRAAFDRLRAAGPPLADGPWGAPTLGTKCGCNAAFLVHRDAATPGRGADDATEMVRAGDRRGPIERALLRPVLRGEHVAAWRPVAHDEHIVWTHDAAGRPLADLPPGAARWLAPWRSALAARSDQRGHARWWSLFRTEGAAADGPRVVWPDVARRPRALLLDAGDPAVPLNTCYVARCPGRADALALAALLNGPLAAAWLGALAEPARGGYRRFLAWSVALLPLPADWPRARDRLAPLAARAIRGARIDDVALLHAAVAAYGLRPADLEPLLTWTFPSS